MAVWLTILCANAAWCFKTTTRLPLAWLRPEVKFLSPSQLAGFGLLGDVSLLAAIYVATGFWGIQASCVLIGLYTLDIRVGWEWGMEAPFPTTIDPLVSSGWVL